MLPDSSALRAADKSFCACCLAGAVGDWVAFMDEFAVACFGGINPEPACEYCESIAPRGRGASGSEPVEYESGVFGVDKSARDEPGATDALPKFCSLVESTVG